ncbi:methyl-accepting chemotaxis protein [Clostridium sp. CTA-19]
MNNIQNDSSTIIRYQKNTLKYVLILYSISAIMAGVTFFTMKILGLFDDLKCSFFIGLSIMILVELVTFKVMYNITLNAIVFDIRKFGFLKKLILIFSYMNYIYMSIFIHSKEFWVVVFYFIIIGALFLDNKMNILSIGLSIVSEILVFSINKTTLPNEFFARELILRIVIIWLISFGILIFTLFASKLLDSVNKNEEKLKENNSQIKEIFFKTGDYAKTLLGASELLTEISEEENQSLEELSNTTDIVSVDANNMLKRAMENKQILEKLLVTNEIISYKTEDNESKSNELIILSNDNEKRLNETLVIIDDIKVSIGSTFEATKILEKKSEEIDEVVAIIEKISKQTNILALNATIEASRAGKYGAGFIIVAESIRKLAKNTEESLKNISLITNEFKIRLKDVEKLTAANINKISYGNETINSGVNNIKIMLTKLKDSGENIKEIKTLSSDLLIQMEEVVEFNTNIYECIEDTINKFLSVNHSVNENVAMSQQVAENAESLRFMAVEMNELIEEK